MKVVLIALISIVAFIFSSEINAATFNAEKLEGTITIDGKLDEPAWQKVQPSSSFQWLKVRAGRHTPAKTNFRLLVNKEAVYFGIHCEEPQMSEILDTPLERDSDIFNKDSVEIFLDPEGRRFRYYQFALSAGNTQWDTYYIEGGNTTIGNYSSLWYSAIYKGKNFWSAEIRIPLSALYYTDSALFSDVWLLNVTRNRIQEKPSRYTTWAPLARGFHDPDNFNKMGNMPKKDSRFDLGIMNMKVDLLNRAEDLFTGILQIETSATKHTAGNYNISVWVDGENVTLKRDIKISEGSGTVKLEDFAVKRLGKVSIKAIVQNDKDEVIHGTYFPVRLEYSPIVIDITEPFYAKCIFPGQDIKEIKGTVTVNLPAKRLIDSQLVVSLTGPGVSVEPVRKKLRNNTVDFSFDASSLKVGEYVLECAMVSSGKTIANKDVTIKKLGQPKGSYVYIDNALNLVVNGKAIFARGWYGDERYLVSEELLKKVPHPDSKFVNMWHERVTMEPQRLDPSEAAQRQTMDVEPSAKVFEEMKKRIEENRENKDILYYYLSDEPECRGISPVYLKYGYDFIKKLDPYRPVMVITRAPEQFTQCADILNPHPYLNPRVGSSGKRTMKSPKHIREKMRTALSAGKGKIPAWCTPQAFSYGFTDSEADHPNFTEFRCMVYIAVANGCKGLTPFHYCAHFNSMDLRLGCDFIYETLAYIEDFLIDPGKPFSAKVDAPEDGVDVWIKRVNGKTLAIAVNLLDRDVTATIDCEGLKRIAALHGFREKGTVKMKNGKMTLNFSPYQVHLLSYPKIGEELKTVDKLMKEIETAKAALKKPGNILYGRGREIEWDASDTYIRSKTLYSLTDGICDSIGWRNHTARATPVRVELAFLPFVPKFKSAKIYTGNVEDLEFYIWNYGEWQKVGEIKGNQSSLIAFDFPKQLSTVKIKILMPKSPAGKRAEIYEIELYE